MTQVMIVPTNIGKINYKPSLNQYTLTYPAAVDPETRKDLSDKKHLSAVKSARKDYGKGLLVEEDKIIKKLKG